MEQTTRPKNLFERAHELWLRIEDHYRKYRLFWTIASGAVAAAVTALLVLLRGLDPIIAVVLAVGLVALLATAWDAFKRTNRWLPTAVSLAALVAVFLVSLASDWRKSVLTWLYKDEPPVTQAESREKQDLIAELRRQISELDVQRRQAILERDEARAAPRPDGQTSAIDEGFAGASADLMRFVNAYAEPATKDLQPLLNMSSGDDDLDNVLSEYLGMRLSNGRAAMDRSHQPNTMEYGSNGRMAEGFCEFFRAYQLNVIWFYRLVARFDERFEERFGNNWFDTGDNRQRYIVWFDKDRLLLERLRELIADPRFDLMGRCVNTVGFDDMIRIRP